MPRRTTEPVLGTVDDLTFLDQQAVDTDLTNSAADPVVLPAATGGDGTLTYTLECAATETGCDDTTKLPQGLVFTAASRTLSGTPTDPGHFDMNYRVEDADGDSDSTSFQITVLVSPELSIDSPSVVEGGDGDTPTLTFTVTLSPASSDTVPVKYADAGSGTATSGTDYDAVTAGTLTFTPGDTEESITVTVNGDAAIESDETVVIKLSDATDAYLFTSNSTGTGTIETDRLPGAFHRRSHGRRGRQRHGHPVLHGDAEPRRATRPSRSSTPTPGPAPPPPAPTTPPSPPAP